MLLGSSPFLSRAGAASPLTDSSLSSSRILLAVFLEMFGRGVTLSPAFAVLSFLLSLSLTSSFSAFAMFSFPPSPLLTSSFFSFSSSFAFSSSPPQLLSETQKKGEQKSLDALTVLPKPATGHCGSHQGNPSCSLRPGEDPKEPRMRAGSLGTGRCWLPRLARQEPTQSWAHSRPWLGSQSQEDPNL